MEATAFKNYNDRERKKQMEPMNIDTLIAELQAFPYLLLALAGNFAKTNSRLTDEAMEEVLFALQAYSDRLQKDACTELLEREYK